MPSDLPPTIAPSAAARWDALLPTASPWLHEEVARRMEDRLQWMTLQPKSWVHWEPLRGGIQAHALLTERYPKSDCYAVHAHAEHAQVTRKLLAPTWWSPARWTGPALHFGAPQKPADMLWANMALHMAADPQALIAQWHQLLEPKGFLMFSCLGPDTVRELRALFAAQGWPPASHAFTDMHDWGDMLVHAGFSEPIMDMERITLTFATPERLLAELRELGRNLHPQRFGALRGRAWHAQLLAKLAEQAETYADGQLRLTFEIVYGHAFKAPPRLPVAPETSVSLDAMRAALRQARKNDAPG
ncbi:MAG: methyltransferase domain-containing protein [Pseudomonadota bacterium]